MPSAAMNRSQERSLLTLYGCTYGVAAIGTPIVAVGVMAWAWVAGSWVGGLVSAAILALLALAIVRRIRQLRSYSHIPGPRPSFFLGNLRELLAFGHGRRDQALEALHDRFGPVVRLHLAWGSATYVTLSRVSKNLHRKDLDSYRRADRTILPRSLMGVAQGERHRAHRQRINPSLASRSVAARLAVLQQVTDDLIRKWQRDPAGADLLLDIHTWSAHSLGAFLFGAEWPTDADLEPYFEALTAIEEEISFRTFHPFFVRWIFPRRARRATAAYRYLFGFLEQVLRERERALAGAGLEEGEARDLLDELVRAKRSGDPALWSHEDCVEEMMSLVLGGTDAMSYAMSQALLLLSQHPHVQEEARASMARIARPARPAGSPGGCPVPHQPSVDVTFVRQIFHETLRLYPAVPFSSKVAHGEVLDEEGLALPAGTNVMWMKTAVGKNQDVFQRPTVFDPARFSTAAGEDRGSVASFLPFGAGLRHCIGNKLSEHQCVLFLASVLQRFHVERQDDVEVDYRATVSVVPSCVPVRLVPIAAPAVRATA